MDLQFLSQCTKVHGVILKGVAIGKIITDIEVIQSGALGSCFELHFKCGYAIKIDERGMALQRTVCRPNHDHNDEERLYENKHTKEQRWSTENFDPKNYEIARIPFGSIVEC